MILLMLSCLYISKEDHDARMSEAQGSTDTGSHDSATTPDGTYQGDFTISGEDTLTGTQDSCVGDAVLTRTGSALDGTLSCAWQGAFRATLGQAQDGEITGSVDANSGSGTVSFTTGLVFTRGWTGDVAADTLSGQFGGTDSEGGLEIEYEGSFAADRI